MGLLEFRREGESRRPTRPSPPIPEAAAATPRKRRRRLRPLLQRLHRWVSLATGIVLLIVVISGAVLVLDPEIHRWLNSGMYQSTASAEPVGPQGALAAVERELPEFEAADVVREGEIWKVYDHDYATAAHVDPGTGEVLGTASEVSGVMGFLKNLHMCGLACKEYPGFVGFMNDRVKLLDNNYLTVGGLILGASGLVLVGLCLSGIVLWWPGLRRMRRGFQLRRANRYKTNYDLHKLAGMVAIPFLLMWAITGAGFEFKQIEQAWYALLPGGEPKPAPSFASEPKRERTVAPEARDREVTMGEAAAIVERRLPGSRLTSISVPDPKDKASYYIAYVADGTDSYEYGLWPGDVEVRVDRYSGRTSLGFGDPEDDRAASAVLWEDWQFPLHAGIPVNPGWRIGWIFLGLIPLLLAITGVTTWLIRRRARRRKRGNGDRSAAAAAA